MEAPILNMLEETLESENHDCTSHSYIDLPELITNIKQEIVGELESPEPKNIKVKEEPLSRIIEGQPYNNSFLVLNQVKIEPIESKKTENCYNVLGEQFNTEHEEISAAAKNETSEEGSYFTYLKTEEIHIKEEEGGNRISSATNEEAKERKIIRQRGFIHKCTECSYMTPRIHHLRNHMIVHDNSNINPKFTCHQCEYKSCHRGNFTRHLQTCKPCKLNGEPSDVVMILKCTDCEYETLDYRNLNRHVLRHKTDSEVEMHKCNQCEYQTKYKSNMKMHVQRHARREQLELLKCPECEYRTFDKNNLDLHIFRHSAENGKTYQCGVCGYITTKKSHLSVHVLRHKDSAEVKIFQCPFCTYRVIRRSDLSRHIDRHKTGKDKKYPNSSAGIMKRLTTLN